MTTETFIIVLREIVSDLVEGRISKEEASARVAALCEAAAA